MSFNLLSRKRISQSNSLASVVSSDLTVTSVVITDSSWNAISQTKLSNTGGYIIINGTLFENGCTVYAGSTAGTVTFVSSTQLRVQFGAVTTGNYPLFVSNPNGNSALYLSTFGFSGTPAWVSDSNLGTYISEYAFAINLSAVSDSNVGYTLAQGSTLPAGITLSSTGLLSGTITGVVSNTTYTFSIVATDAENQTITKTFTISVQGTEPYFKNTTLFLAGNTATPSWITDASTNNFSITVVGDTIPTMLSPFSATDTTSGSAYFDGTGDYLSIADSTAFTLSTNNFTFEGWVYSTVAGVTQYFAGQSNSAAAAASTSIAAYKNASNQLGFYVCSGGTVYDAPSSVALSLNVWAHFACVRDGATLRIYVNGVQTGSVAVTGVTVNDSANQFALGRLGEYASSIFTGYLSSIRFINGTCLYPSGTTFIPPTSSLTAVTNTQLLALQYFQGENNNRFVDESTNRYPINKTGKASQGTFSPFSPTGWSNYADTANQGFSGAVSLIGLAVTTFTAECWIYMTADPASADGIPCLIGMDAIPGSSIYLGFGPNASRQLVLRWFDTGSKTATGASILALNAWYHIAVVANLNAISIYVNGVAETLSGTTTLTNRGATTNQFALFNNSSASAYQFKGYASDIRVTTLALYTTNFTPNITPLTAITGTVLLTAQSNQFVDTNTQTSAKALTMIGAPSVQAFSPYAPTNIYSATTIGGSGYFNYSGGGYLKVPIPATSFYSATGAWTWECWVYPLSFSGPQYGCPIFASSVSSMQIRAMPTSANSTNLNMYAQDAASSVILGSSGTSAGSIRINEWSHVVLQRRAGEFEMFLNGTRISNVNTQTASSLKTVDTFLWIGASNDGANPYWNGYISGVRIQNGTARYSGTTITVPTTLANPTGAAICTNFTNIAVIDSTSRNVLETAGDARTSAVQTKFGNGSIFFDGTGDYLYAVSSPNFELSSGDFTIEGWIYTTLITGSERGIFGIGTTDPDSNLVRIQGSSSKLQFWLGGSNSGGSGAGTKTGIITCTTALSLNTWYHIALVRSGSATNNVKLYLNGVVDGQGTGTYTITSKAFILGGGYPGSAIELFVGYVDDFRVTKGIARYTANFTAPISSFALR